MIWAMFKVYLNNPNYYVTYMEVIFYCNADRFDYRFESSISLKQKNRMPIDIDILFFYILNYLDYFFTSTITSVLSAS